jgi:FHA domain-containing protein/uncharacterized protein DUF1707
MAPSVSHAVVITGPNAHNHGVRANEIDRDRAIEVLRSGYAQGYLSAATLEARIGRAFEARTAGELRYLTGDLPAEQGMRGALRELLNRIRSPRPAGRGVTVLLPDDDRPALIGRSPACDAVLDDLSVSRRHLELRPIDGRRWLAVDLGSTNGTWFFGRRVSRVVVERGDQLLVGGCPIVLS